MVGYFIVQEEHPYGNKQMSSSLTNGHLKNRIPYERKDEASVVTQTIESSYSEPLLTPSSKWKDFGYKCANSDILEQLITITNRRSRHLDTVR